MSNPDTGRYIRHLSLPDFDLGHQDRLAKAHVLVIGAGGLGAAALPYLAGAGIGQITIADHDNISVHNLHRQTIYKTSQADQSKAELAANYIRALNPGITAEAMTSRIDEKFDPAALGVTLLMDGSDNFETKAALNTMAIRAHIPLITASVNQYKGQCGIFAGHLADAPCYACLFPAFPQDARNCNEAGVLGTAAGLTGMYQAHLALMFLAGYAEAQPGLWLECDFKTMRLQKLSVPKDHACAACTGKQHTQTPIPKKEPIMIEILTYDALKNKNALIIDVRTAAEIADDPIADAVHIEMSEIPHRHGELPQDKLLAFVCAGNIRSMKVAQYLQGALGYQNVCVLDKFSI